MSNSSKSPSYSTQKTSDHSGITQQSLLESLEETKRELDLSYLGFHQSLDPDLIAHYLFQIDALHAKYNYLLRQIKALA